MNHPFPDDIRNPARKTPNPFADESLVPPDNSPAHDESSVRDNVFQADSSPYRPRYQMTYRVRTTGILICGIVGLAGSLFGWLAFIGRPIVIPMPILSVVFSLAAVGLGYSQLNMIKAGVAARELTWVYAAIAMGLVGLMNSLLIFLTGVFYFNWLRWL